jgi:hypothetical protein
MTALLLEWMMRRTHRRLCATVGQWLEPHERSADVAVGHPVWTIWPCFGGIALLFLAVLAFEVTDDRLWPGAFVGLAGVASLWAPALIGSSTVMVETTAGRVVCLDASPFRSVCQRTPGPPGGRTPDLPAHGQQKSRWADS